MCNLSPRGVVGQVLVREGSAVGEKPAYGSVRATTSVSMKRSKHSTLAKVFSASQSAGAITARTGVVWRTSPQLATKSGPQVRDQGSPRWLIGVDYSTKNDVGRMMRRRSAAATTRSADRILSVLSRRINHTPAAQAVNTIALISKVPSAASVHPARLIA